MLNPSEFQFMSQTYEQRRIKLGEVKKEMNNLKQEQILEALTLAALAAVTEMLTQERENLRSRGKLK